MEDKLKIRICSSGLKFKEESKNYVGLVATTHPDRVGDILSVKALNQIAGYINNSDSVGDQNGSYRSVSVSHDWIKEQNPELDEAAFLLPNAQVIELEDGHFGVQVEMKLNEFYRGDMSPQEIKSRIDDGHFGGLSIEYDTDREHSKTVISDGNEYNFIDELTTYGGQALARSRMIANPHAVLYKEVEKMAEEEINQTETSEETQEVTTEETQEETTEESTEETQEDSTEETQAEEKEEELDQKEVKLKKDETPTLSVKELFESKEFKNAVEKELKVENKVFKEKEKKMEENTLSIKEMNKAASGDSDARFTCKEATSLYLKENDASLREAFKAGVPLNTTLQVKCQGTKLMIASQLNLQTKDTLDTGTNPSTYTQNATELADVYMPGLVDTFNNQTNLFGALRKVDNIEGSDKFGWRTITSQSSSLSVDVDDTSIDKKVVKKLKLQTQFKEYRIGVSVTDYMLNFSRASMGDLFRVEVEKGMRDLMKDINKDLFTEQVDDGTKILGLEAVADSAGNTTIYGLTRTAANRLAPDAAGDTYQAVGGAVTDALLQGAATKVEEEGAAIANIRYVVSPSMRDKIYQLASSKQRFGGTDPNFGFNTVHKFGYNGYPMIVDFDCPSDAVFVYDDESYYIAIDRAPQLVGLAKVGAADEGYVSTYLAAVYEQPRRIHMLDTLS
jgi:hypothetical protein